MSEKQPNEYFVYPEFWVWCIVPIIWGFLPMAAFHPELMEDFLDISTFKSLLIAQVIHFEL